MAKKRLKVVDKKDSAEWEAEQVVAESKTKIEQDTGTGQPVVIRFFQFGANVEEFKKHKPTAQELFNSHLKGMEATLWRDGLKPFDKVEPRLIFSKDKSKYQFVITCIPTMGSTLIDTPKTLSQIFNDPSKNSV